MDIEGVLEGAKPRKGNLKKKFEEVAGDEARYFKLSERDGAIHLERNKEEIASAAAYFGRMVLISRAKLEWDDALAIYKERDLVEKFYDQLKNDLDFETLRVHSVEALQGMVFVFFLALALRALLKEKARGAGLLEKHSLEDILRELAKMRAVRIGSSWTMSEVSAKQRNLLQKMEVPVPLRPSLVIK
jgi:transposase